MLAAVEGWRAPLRRALVGRDEAAVQRALNRVLFSKMCAARGLEVRGLEAVGVAEEVLAGLGPCELREELPHTLGLVYEQSPGLARKAGGAVYTPSYVTQYICKRTIGDALVGKTPTEALRLRIVDPACGSGAFLLAVYHYLIEWCRDWYVNDGPAEWSRLGQLERGPFDSWRLTLAARSALLNNCIYGVDIDELAVEVTRLSLTLMLLAGETGVQAAPALSRTIKWGNALIGRDFSADAETLARVRPFDWAEFGVDGFDLVVGNPPYVRIHRVGHAASDYLFKRYSTLRSKADLSLAFIEKSLELVAERGCVGLLNSSQWMATDYGRALRERLAGGLVREIVDFEGLTIFKKLSTYTAIVILGRRPLAELVLRRVTSERQLTCEGIERAAVSKVHRTALSGAPWKFQGVSVVELLARRSLAWRPLRAFGKAYIGAKSGLAQAFVVDAETARRLEPGLLLPYAYQGGEVARYARVRPQAFIIYPYERGEGGAQVLIREERLRGEYPRTYAHLLGCREALRGRLDSRRLYAAGDDWYRFMRPGGWRVVDAEKLIIKGIARRGTVGVLGAGAAFDGANCPSVVFDAAGGPDVRYFLALLNSRVMEHYFRSMCPAKMGGYMRYSASIITSAPIRVLDLSRGEERAAHDRIVGLVERLVVGSGDAEALEREVDAEVFALYGVGADEARLLAPERAR